MTRSSRIEPPLLWTRFRDARQADWTACALCTEIGHKGGTRLRGLAGDKVSVRRTAWGSMTEISPPADATRVSPCRRTGPALRSLKQERPRVCVPEGRIYIRPEEKGRSAALQDRHARLPRVCPRADPRPCCTRTRPTRRVMGVARRCRSIESNRRARTYTNSTRSLCCLLCITSWSDCAAPRPAPKSSA